MSHDPVPVPLRLARTALGLKQADLAVMANLTQETISRIETGREQPRQRTKHALVAALGHPIDFAPADETDLSVTAAIFRLGGNTTAANAMDQRVNDERRTQEHERVARDLEGMGYADLAADVRQRAASSRN